MRAKLARDFERFAGAMPPDPAGYIRDAYRIDLSARYLGRDLPHPIGKASGQLSLKPEQLEADAEAGLAFTVLKTVIACDEAGEQSMAAWAVPESRMKVEQRRSADGREGWTVTWKGRGWDRSLEEYLSLVRAGRDLDRAGRLFVVPSVKYHLPPLGRPFRIAEYRYTTARLAGAWGDDTLPLEKDFSPTLAGDPLAGERDQILRWLHEVPNLIRRSAPGDVRVSMKLMNARFDDTFQVEMMRAAAVGGADQLVVFNRLFDARRGVAYGGWDLSGRNLRVLDLARGEVLPPLAGTGNIISGRMVAEYAARGCECVQLHTWFQVPLSCYPATAGNRSSRALHALLFDPVDGLVSVMLELEASGRLGRRDGALHFLDLARGHED